MFLETGQAWAESIRKRWRDDPFGLVVATRFVTFGSYAALAAAALLFFLAGSGSLLALLAGILIAGLGIIGVVASVFLRLPPWIAWWTRPRSHPHPQTGTVAPPPDAAAKPAVNEAA